jgi:hypothetical protein
MAVAVPLLRRRRDRQAQFVLPWPYLFAGLGLIFSLLLLTQMGKGEFVIVGATCVVALANWLVVRR